MTVNRPLPRMILFLVAFVLSFAMLGYEILLTRIASILLTSQYIFLILGVSLLGISAGAFIEYFLGNSEERLNAASPDVWLSWAALLLVIALFAILKLGNSWGVLMLSLSTALPFIASGFIFSRLFRLFSEHIGNLYAADLIGAAAGALSVPILLPAIGPIQSILLQALILATVAAFIALMTYPGWKALMTISVLAVMAGLFFVNGSTGFLGKVPIGKNIDKDLYRLIALNEGDAEIVDSRWSTFGRTDLVRFGNDTSMMSIFIDGAAGANMLRFKGNFDDSSASFVEATVAFSGMVPLLNLKESQKDKALIIGPGGGRDVLLALKAGFRKITAVEVNPQMVDLVKDYRDFDGGIYTDYRNIQVVVAEGRNYLRHSNEKYDLIMLYMPITKSSRGLNSFALTENYLFTKEAFSDYYNHLTDEGSLLIMAHGMPEVFKIVTTALDALNGQGIKTEQAMEHIYVLGSQMMPLFGLRKTPVQSDEAEFLHAAAHYTMFDCQYSFIPGIPQQTVRVPLSTSVDAGVPMMNEMFINLANGQLALARLETGTNVNLEPATDNRPFFFQYSYDLPAGVSTILWLSLASLLIILLLPGYYFRSRFNSETKVFTWHLPFYFVSIGMGYIILELVLFQKLVFYLGDPSRSLSLLLAGLLLGSGLGSYFSRKASEKIAITGGMISAVLALAFWIAIPALLDRISSQSPGMKLFVSASLLILQGVPMGVMFPIGLRVSEAKFGKRAVPWMWAINGSASVLGSAVAVAIAMSWGYTTGLLFAALIYLIAASTFQLFRKASVDAEASQTQVDAEVSQTQ